MWLATIETSRVAEEARPKLERFQLEAADVLADHFFGPARVAPVPPPPAPPSLADKTEAAKLMERIAARVGVTAGKEAEGVLLAHAAATITGEPVKLFLPALPSGRWLRPTEIAEELGATVSKVGRTITALGLRGHPERCRSVMDQKANGSGQVTCYLYDEQAVDSIRAALEADVKKK